MRLSRNRNWGHPLLIAYLEQLANDARAIGWPGLLIGDMAQPRGGPMLTGHSSHQIGLDADIWLTPMPTRVLSRDERENMTAVSMLRDPLNVDRKVWTPTHTRLIRLASSYPEVERIFVHPAIKQALCDQAGPDRAWLSKVRPWWGHYYHFHVRIACPPGSASCKGQKDVAQGEGCGAELDGWFQRLLEAERKPAEPDKPAKARPLTVADLPNDCRAVLASGGGGVRTAKPQTVDKPAGPPPPRLKFDAGRKPAPFGVGGLAMAPASPHRSRNALAVLPCGASLIVLMLAGCATQPAFVAGDYAKCQELGFQHGSREYAVCLTEVQKRRTTLASAPEPIVE